MFQQLLIESLVLAAAGGARGLYSRATLGAGAAPANQIPRAQESPVDARVLLFALAASIVTGILAGAAARPPRGRRTSTTR